MIKEKKIAFENLPYIAIGGCPRSGTTALMDLLNLDPKILIGFELRIFKCWNKPIGGNLLIAKMNHKRRDGIAFTRKKIDTEDVIKKVVSGYDMCDYIWHNTSDYLTFGDKLPRFYLYNAKKLSKMFPNMKFLFCLRDGRNVIASQIRSYNKGSKANFCHETIEQCEYLWIESCNHLLSNLSDRSLKNKCLLIKYEDAVINPIPTILKIDKFLNIDLNIKNHNYKPVHMTAWKEEHPDMMNKLSGSFKKWLEYWGYE